MDSISDIVGNGRRQRASRATAASEDRLPPHDELAEKSVISCVLQDPSSIGQCVLELGQKPEVFYDERFKLFYNVLLGMYDAHEGIDFITVKARLEKRGVLDQIGGVNFISEVQDTAPSVGMLGEYIKLVRSKYLQRKLLTLCTEAAAKAYDFTGDDVQKLLLETEAGISALTEAEAPNTEKHMREVMAGVISDMEQWHYTRGSQQLRGLPTGPKGNYLDKVLTGIRETHYVVIAGRPGGGKSAKAFNIVEYLAEHHEWYEPTGQMIPSPEDPAVMIPEQRKHKGIPIGVFTIEMDNESLGYRLVFGRAGVSEAKFNQGFAEAGAEAKLVRAASELSKMNIYLDDTPAQTIGQIAAKARRMVKQHGIKLFVLDYLQLAQGDDPRDEKRVQVDKISKKIMALKKQLKVPWIVLAQLNRNIETANRDGRAERNPVLSDLAESGSIEQDADKVIILKNTSRREVEEDDDGNKISDEDQLNKICSTNSWDWSLKPRRVDLWVVKNRRGPTGKAEEVFQGNICKFTDWHMFKVAHGVEGRHAGESKSMENQTSSDDFAAVAAGT